MTEEIKDHFTVLWHDSGFEPSCPPNPAAPTGIAIDAVPPDWDGKVCSLDLPYPAKRIGVYKVVCNVCGFSLGITTAGRPDDPKSVRFPCMKPQEH